MILRRKVLRSDDSSPENSSLEKKFPGGGKFFAGKFFTRMILRRKLLRYSYFLLGRKILRRRIIHSKKIPGVGNNHFRPVILNIPKNPNPSKIPTSFPSFY
jgi:hypothetical protein